MENLTPSLNRNCATCGTAFSVRLSPAEIARGRGKYCSHACQTQGLIIPAEQRFWKFVHKDGPLFRGTPCWIWTGKKNKGHGGFWVNGTTVPAHRFAYELLVGAIPDTMTIDHLCWNRPCVNPAHMEPVPHSVNILRSPIALASINHSKTHCFRGHEFTPENTLWERSGAKRVCRTCKNTDRRRRRREKREAAAAH